MDFSITEEIKKQGAMLGAVGAVGGFISDVLQPLAPLSFYVFIISTCASCLLIFSFVLMRARRRKLFQAFLLTGAFAIFSGILVGLHSDETKAKGVIASSIPVVEQLQTALGIIQKDIAEIKQTTRETAETVKKLEQTGKETAEVTKKIAESTDRIASSLDAIQKGFSRLSASGGIIEAPQRPEEYYHNARLYEQRGDYLNARKSYNTLFTFKLDFLDPHLRYQTFLKVQEGRAGAREIYSALYEMDKRPVIEFARILMFDEPQRLSMLGAFISANGDFAPAWYELSREHSQARKGVQSLNDKQEELKALETFMALHEKGQFLKYFIDKELASEWIKDAETRLKSLEVLKRSAGDNPVSISTGRHNSGWTITLVMQETPREIFYRVGDDGEFKSTGMSQFKNQATGYNLPQMYFELSPKTGKTPVYIRYTDVGGQTRGPFEVGFDPEKELLKSQKSILEQTRNSWVAFRDFDGKLLVYFTHLISYRCALEEVRYAINSNQPDLSFALPPCDPDNPFNVPTDGKIWLEAPLDSRYLAVEVRYRDGTSSGIQKIER